MTTKQYFWSVLLAVVTLAGVSSCSKDDSPYHSITNQEEYNPPLGEVVHIDLSGEYLVGSGSQSRYIGTTSEEGIKITLSSAELQNPKKLRLHLVQEENPSVVTTIYVTPTITEPSTGKYRISYKGEVQLQGQNQSFSQGTWYIGGIYGASDANTTFALPGNASHILLSNDEEVELGLPLVLGWTRLYTRTNPAPDSEATTKATTSDMSVLSPDLGRNFALKYKPDGILLRVRAINGMLSPLPIAQVVVETNEFSAGAAKYPAVTGVTATKLRGGAAPSPLTSTEPASKTVFRIEASIPKGLQFTYPGKAVVKDAYIWLHETSRTYQSGTKTRLWLNANGPKASQNSKNQSSDAHWGKEWPIDTRLTGWNSATQKFITEPFSEYDNKDVGGRKNNRETTGVIRYRLYGGDRSYLLPKRSLTQPYVGGNMVPANLEATSDLILSEVFVEKAYERTSTNPVSSYALIEIYNPTLREIDLSNYGLVRIFTRDETHDRTVCPGIVTSGNPGDVIDSALVLPLNPTQGYTKWTNNKLSVKPDLKKWNQNEAYVHTPLGTYTGYTISHRDYSLSFGCDALTTTSKLAPGKTMIILSGKYNALPSSYSPNVTRNGYTTVNSERVPEVFKQIKDAVDQGYCQYVISANNAKVADAAPNSESAGVMSVGLLDFFSIVKIKSNGQRTFVDSDWLYDWVTMIQERNFLNANRDFKGYVRKKSMPLVGNNSIMFSQDYLNRTFYEVGGTSNYSTFGVSEYNEYSSGWHYSTHIQPLVNKRDNAKISSR